MAVQPPRWSSNWSNSDRKEELPENWGQIRRETAARAGGRCEAKARTASGAVRRCPLPGTDCDHYGEPWEHDKTRWLCRGHHNQHTAAQSAEARRRMAAKLKHPGQKHPGML